MNHDAAREREHIAELVAAINDVFPKGDPNAIRAVLDEIFHADAVIRGPGFTLMAEGKAACIQSYVDFAAAAKIRSFQCDEPQIDLYDDMAVASYGWKMRYSLADGEHDDTGKDVFMFVREGGKWLAAWRALS